MRADDHGGPTHSCSPLCPESTLPLEDRLDALREAAASVTAALRHVVAEACRRCRHTANPSVPVEVYDTLDGRPEIVRWLCSDCLEETHGPPPKGPGSGSGLGGITTAEATEGIRRLQRQTQQQTRGY